MRPRSIGTVEAGANVAVTTSAPKRVTTLSRLSSLGVDPVVCERWIDLFRAQCDVQLEDIPLTELQESALNTPGSLDASRNLIIAGPTSAGKTLVAEAVIASAISRSASAKVLYLVPLRALVTEKAERFEELFGTESVIRASSDYPASDNVVSRGRWNIAVVVFDKAYQWLGRPEIAVRLMRDLSLIVVDEVQVFGEERGEKLEGLVAYARYLQRTGQRKSLRLVAMGGREAATPLADWLDADVVPTSPVARPIPLFEGWVDLNGACEIYEDGSAPRLRIATKRNDVESLVSRIPPAATPEEMAINLVERFSREGLRTIVYSKGKRASEQFAWQLARGLTGGTLASAFMGALDELEDSAAVQVLRKTLPKGVGFHHGGMLLTERSIVERGFSGWTSDGFIHTVVATPTLGMGVNLPADVVLMLDSVTFGGRKSLVRPEDHGSRDKGDPLSILQYRNYAGRAGRYSPCPKRSSQFGLALSIRTPANADTVDNWLHGEATPLGSSLHDPSRGIEPHILTMLSATSTSRNRSDAELTLLASELLRGGMAADEDGLLMPRVETAVANLISSRLIVRGQLSNLGYAAARHHLSLPSVVGLRQLAERLHDLVPRNEFQLMYELCTLPEMADCYPFSPLAITPSGRERQSAKRLRGTRSFVLERIDARSYDARVSEVLAAKSSSGSGDPSRIDVLTRAAVAWAWSRGLTVTTLRPFFQALFLGDADQLGRRLAACMDALHDIFQSTVAADISPDDADRIAVTLRIWAQSLRHGVRWEVLPLALFASQSGGYVPSRTTMRHLLAALNGRDDVRLLAGRNCPTGISYTSWRSLQKLLDGMMQNRAPIDDEAGPTSIAEFISSGGYRSSIVGDFPGDSDNNAAAVDESQRSRLQHRVQRELSRYQRRPTRFGDDSRDGVQPAAQWKALADFQAASDRSEEDSLYSAVESIFGRPPLAARIKNRHEGRMWIQPSAGVRGFGLKLILDGNVKPPLEEVLVFRELPDPKIVNAAFGTRTVRLITTLDLLYFGVLLLEDRDAALFSRFLDLPDRTFLSSEEAMFETLLGPKASEEVK